MSGPLLEARGLRKSFTSGRGGNRRIVHAVVDVDLRIEAGETHGLVGESGSGKSTIGRIVLRLIEPDAGTATFRGRDLFALKGAELRRMRRHLQLVYQDPFSSVDPRFRARDIVAEPWEIHGLYDGPERRRRADELLARVGIDPSLGDRRPGSFSGGQLQRIGIARALALEPSLIVCDEPVSALDVSVQGQILNLLLDLKQELGIAYLFISHDLAVVRHMSDRVSVMVAGRIVETGTRDEVFRGSQPSLHTGAAGRDGPAGRRRPEAGRGSRERGGGANQRVAGGRGVVGSRRAAGVRGPGGGAGPDGRLCAIARAARWPSRCARSSGRPSSTGGGATRWPATSPSRDGPRARRGWRGCARRHWSWPGPTGDGQTRRGVAELDWSWHSAARCQTRPGVAFGRLGPSRRRRW